MTELRLLLSSGKNVLFVIERKRSRTGDTSLYSFYTLSPKNKFLIPVDKEIAATLNLKLEPGGVRSSDPLTVLAARIARATGVTPDVQML